MLRFFQNSTSTGQENTDGGGNGKETLTKAIKTPTGEVLLLILVDKGKQIPRQIAILDNVLSSKCMKEFKPSKAILEPN